MTHDSDRDAVIVPWAPGPVVRVGAEPREIDALLDEVFGPPDSGGPSWFDAVLLVGGVVLLVRGWHVLGGLVLVLGLALPVRSLARRVRHTRKRRRYRVLLERGQPLHVAHASTAALLAAYESLLAGGSATAVEAAHRAMVECASLLGGRAPVTDEEQAYVTRRTAAIRAVVDALAAPVDETRVAAVRAREEVDAASGRTSLDDLQDVARQVRRAP